QTPGEAKLMEVDLNDSVLLPVLALIVWSLIVWAWMYALRIPAMQKAGIRPDDARHPGSLDALPASARQVADNYNHLMEQPTIFYALAFFVVLAGHDGGLAVTLAWAYVGLRVVHSLIQNTVNRVMLRFLVFSISTLVLVVWAVRELMAVL
ncbi:MAG TPA: MAPEG family protein, partial [Caulobacteraceae bacterium]|nr:MAPEG family protein [Caulobacteraceae bacterium]